VSILTALQPAALRLLGRRPTVFFGASGTFEMELCDLVNDVADDIASYQDLQTLIRFASFNGDGTDSAFDLPADYDRMMLVTDVQDAASWCWGFERFTDINQFLFYQDRGFIGNPGGWIIYQDQMHFAPAPSVGMVARFPYITKNKVNGGTKVLFDNDADTFDLPERLLTLGVVWRYREQKKLDAAGDQEAFEKALDEYGGKDKGSTVIRSRARRRIPGVGYAWPGVLG